VTSSYEIDFFLRPFLHGGFMEKWLSLINVASPDTLRKHPTEVKVLGCCLLNTFTRACSPTEPINFGNMLLLLTGPRRSAKSWLTGLIEDVMRLFNGPHLIPHGTPEYIGEAIGKLRWGILTANEAGEIITNADNKGYMSTWGYIINKIYMLEGIQMGRRKKGKSIMVQGRSYYVSLLMNALPGDITTMFEHWSGLERRFIPLSFTRVPRRAWKATQERHAVLNEMISILKSLSRAVVIVDLPEEPLSEVGSKLDKEDADKPDEIKALNDAKWEYAIRLTLSVFIDRAVTQICHLLERGERRGEGSLHGGCNYVISPVTDSSDRTPYRGDILEMYPPDITVELSPPAKETLQVMVTSVHLLSPLWGQFVTGLMGLFGFDGKIASRVAEMLNMVKSKGCVNLRDLYRGPLKPLMKLREIGGVKGLWVKIIGPLEAAGQIAVRRYVKGQTLVFDPNKRYCGTCSKWGTLLQVGHRALP